jgi:hypothetical protein
MYIIHVQAIASTTFEDGAVDNSACCGMCQIRWSVVVSRFPGYDVKMWRCPYCGIYMCSLCCKYVT